MAETAGMYLALPEPRLCPSLAAPLSGPQDTVGWAPDCAPGHPGPWRSHSAGSAPVLCLDRPTCEPRREASCSGNFQGRKEPLHCG